MQKKTESRTSLETQLNEIEVAKVCWHTCVLKLLDVYEDDQKLYFVMEYLEAVELFAYLKSSDRRLTE